MTDDPNRAGLDEPRAASPLTVIRTVADAERRRFNHRHTATRRKRALLLVGLIVFLPVLAGIVLGAHRLGQSVAAGGAEGALQLTRWYLPVSLALYAFYGVNESGNRLAGFGARDLLLTTVRDRDLVLALLYADLREAIWGVFGPTALVIAAFGLGTGSPTAAVVGAAAIALAVTAAAVVGYAVGLAGRLALQAVPLSAGKRSLLSGTGQVGYVLLFAVGGAVVGSTGAQLEDELTLSALAPEGPPPIPLGYYADLFFLGTPQVDGLGLGAAASALALVATVPLGVMATVELAPRLWHADRPVPAERDVDRTDDAGDTAAESRSSAADRRNWPWLGFPAGYVADGILRRVIRTPQRLMHVVYYVLVVGMIAAGGVTEPTILPLLLGGGLVGLGVWLAGGAVGLNPLGEEGAMLGQLVLTETPPESFVRARVLAGTVVGLPVVLVGTALLAVGPLSAVEAALAGAFWVVLLPASAGLAVGIGSLLPKTEPGQVLERIEARPPEFVAIAAHAVLTGMLAVAGGVLLVLDLPATLRWGGLAAVALSTVIAGDAGYRFAVGAVADYGRPRRPDPVYALELGTGIAVLGLALSVTAQEGLLGLASAAESAGFVVAFLGSYVGWATVGAAYLLATDRWPDWLDRRLPTGADAGVLAVGVVGSLGIYVAHGLSVSALDLPVVSHAVAEQLRGNPELIAVTILLALAVNAPIEELFFRNVVQKRLGVALNARATILATAVIFAAIHLPSYLASDPLAISVALAPLVALGALWGWLYHRSGTVVVPAVCHGVYNAAVFGTLLL